MQLQAARNILTAKGCAEPAKDSWNGHSKEAEQLKKEIDQMIDQLEQAKEKAFQLGVGRGIDPFLTLSFMALPGIPSLRITTRGVFDVNSQSYV